MNRKKLEKVIVKALSGIVVGNIVFTGAIQVNAVTLGTNEVIMEEILQENLGADSGINILQNEDFEVTILENDNTYKYWWENQMRPSKWQLRKWSGAVATGENKPYGRVIEESDYDSGKFVEVELNNSVGFLQPDDFMKIIPNQSYEFSVKIKTSGVTSEEPLAIRMEYYDDSNKVVERKDIHKISGNNDWTEYKSTVGTSKAATKMKVIFVFGRVSADSIGATGKIAIDNLQIDSKESNIEKVEFESEEIIVGIGGRYIPKVTVYPKEATEKYTLESNNEEVAEIKDGKIYGLKEGIVDITAVSESGKVVGILKVNVEEVNNESYNIVLDRIFETLVPNSIIDINDKQMQGIINTAVNNGNKYWTSMLKTEDKKGLWSDTTSTTNSAHITTQYNRLYDMAVAYVMDGSSLKGNADLLNDIIYGLDYMIANKYNGVSYYNNWWDWEVGAPQKLNSILILIREHLTEEKILQNTDVIDSYVKNPTMHTQGKYPAIGANRSDMCKVVIYSGLLSKNEGRIKLGVKELDILFKYVDDVISETGSKTDGYYKDGSWIEHGSIPYAGSYGAVLIGGIGEINHILSGTEWAIEKEKMNVMYKVILDSFEPLIYKGSMMNMVSGRAISRDNELDYGHGFGFMRRVLAFYTETAPEEYKNRFKSMIKEWIVSNDVRDIVGKSTNLQFTAQIKELMKDESIKPRGELIGNYMFPNMDRVVHRRPGYVFGLSMYSNRVANYESLNGENLKGYHTADGMTYLYNGDIEQYAKDFWPTVDSKRLPGTTVDTKDIFKDVAGTSYGPGETATSMQNWVGGANIGEYGVSGIYLDNKRSNPKKDLGMDLEAKKSYFMFDDEIVALGAGITSAKDNGVETTIENRLIDKELDKLYINGDEVTNSINNETKIDNAKWAYLEGNMNQSNIGYYFPAGTDLNVKKDTRTGTWKDVNNGKSDAVKTNTFFTLWKDHGVNPKNDTYEYVLLPNKSKEEVEAYSVTSDIEIIVNNEEVQAVREKEKKVVAANFWNDGETVIESIGLKSDKKASIIIKEADDEIEISISDPTMNNKGSIKIELDEELKEVKSKDDNILVESVNDKTLIIVDVNGASGQSFKAKFTKRESDIETPEEIVVEKVKKLDIESTKNSAKLTWEAPSSSNGIIGYVIYKDGKEVATVASNTTEYLAENLKSNTIYRFKVVTKYSNGKFSKPVSKNIRMKKK